MSGPRPPRIATRLLERCLRVDEQEELVGDLDEQYRHRVAAVGPGAAARWYWRQALALAWGFCLHRRDVVSANDDRPRGREAAQMVTTDVRYGWRSLRQAPSFAVVAILTLTFGIGLSTTVFSLVNGILLHSLPYAGADRLVRLAEFRPGEVVPQTGGQLSDTAVGLWMARHETLEALAPYDTNGQTVTTPMGVDNMVVAAVGGSFFDVLAIQPAVGRLLLPADMDLAALPVAIISQHLWTSSFGHSADIIGRALLIEGQTRVIVGVTPSAFVFPTADVDVWVPGSWRWPPPGGRRMFGFHINTIARLRPGASLADANLEGASIARAIAAADPNAAESPPEISRMRVRALLDDVVAPVKPALLTLGVGMALVLLAACVSVANLILARDTARQRDLAVRLSLGASRWRIARPVLIEQGLLAGAGGLLGALLAWWILRSLPLLAPADLPRLGDVHFDLFSLAFTSAVALATAVTVGLLPVWQLPATDVRELSAGGRVRIGRATRSADTLRGVLVVGQIAVAVVLLTGAFLVGQSLVALLRVNTGYQPAGVLTFQVRMPDGVSRQKGRQTQFYTDLLDRLRHHPSVVSAAASAALPLHDISMRMSISIEGRPRPANPTDQAMAISLPATTDYLRTIGTRVVRGRGFTDRDTMDTTKVLLIDETLETQCFPHRDAIGQRVHSIGNQWWTIVGVVEAVHMDAPGVTPDPMFYFPTSQVPELIGYGWSGGVTVRTTGDPLDLVPFIRDQVRQVDARLPVYNIGRLTDQLRASIAQPRFYAGVLGLFAVLALSTALLGVYGVLAYAVERRRLEFGVRRALGATERHVMALVLRRGVVLAAFGIALGLGGAALSARFMRALLFGITPADPWSYAGAAALVFGVVLAASWQPVRRALRIDPARALRVN
jgi:putative ABC transport system permease protein